MWIVIVLVIAVCVHAQYSYRRRHINTVPPCENGLSDDNSFSELESKIRESDFVFTGKVTAVPESSKKETEEYWIRVKRILKGEVGDRNQQTTLRVRRQDKQKNCYRRPIRIHHTAIFLAKNSGGDVTMELIVDPLPLTLTNLDRVNAAVKDMTYKPRPPLNEEPCEKIYCAYGANCVHTPDGRGECQCPTECPPTYTPICGSDGVTYTNHCIMRMTACRQEKNIRKQHAGECDPRSSKRRHRG